MRIFEITNLYNNPYAPEDDIGLMTLQDFLYYRNPTHKSHPSEVYQTTIDSLNGSTPVSQFEFKYGYNQPAAQIFLYENGSIIIDSSGKSSRRSVHADAVILNNVLYYTIKFPITEFKKSFPLTIKRYTEITINPSEIKPVKYLAKGVAEKNLKYYPDILQRIKIDDEYLTIRTTEKTNEKNKGKSIVILNQDNKIVGYASDEWGATLLRVADEYRGKNLGKILGNIWYKNNPSFTSGGFSSHGKSNAIQIWANRVRELLNSGSYSWLINDNQISHEQVNKILADLPERKKIKPKEPTPAQNIKSQILLYSDNQSTFVIYDSRFYQEQDEKYLYAHGFLRNTGDKTYVFALDYDTGYEDIATYSIFQIAYNNKQKLYIKSPPSDHLMNIQSKPNIKIEGDFAYLTAPVINLKLYADREAQYRRQHDKYGEIYNSLLEIANSKWQ